MSTTGWMGDGQGDRPALPTANMLLSQRERGAGDVLAEAMARSQAAEARQAREEAAAALDPDEHAANLITAGYAPGMLTDLSRRLGETMAELADERAKIERGKRREQRVMADHAAGRIGAWDIQRALD